MGEKNQNDKSLEMSRLFPNKPLVKVFIGIMHKHMSLLAYSSAAARPRKVTLTNSALYSSVKAPVINRREYKENFVHTSANHVSSSLWRPTSILSRITFQNSMNVGCKEKLFWWIFSGIKIVYWKKYGVCLDWRKIETFAILHSAAETRSDYSIIQFLDNYSKVLSI